jgi:hypothetical protein
MRTCTHANTHCDSLLANSQTLDGRQSRILILQHPKEFKRKTIGTVPLIKLVLGHGCEVIVSPFTGKKVGQHFNDHPKVLEAVQSGEMPMPSPPPFPRQ